MSRAKSYADTLISVSTIYLVGKIARLLDVCMGNRWHRHTNLHACSFSTGSPRATLLDTNLNSDTRAEVACAFGMIDSRHQHHGFQIESTRDRIAEAEAQ